jgi:hypothetical protein
MLRGGGDEGTVRAARSEQDISLSIFVEPEAAGSYRGEVRQAERIERSAGDWRIDRVSK